MSGTVVYQELSCAAVAGTPKKPSYLVDQRRIGRGILRFQALDLVDVSRVTDDDGVFLELIELTGHGE